MKKLGIGVFSVLVTLLLVLPAFAQMDGDTTGDNDMAVQGATDPGPCGCQCCGGMMGGGMMGGGMMRGGMGRGMMGMGMMKHGMMGEGMWMEHEWMHIWQLDLSDTQKTRIRDVKMKTAKEVIKKSADLKIAGLELKDLLEKEPVDMKAVEAKLRQIEGLRTEIKLAHIQAREQVRQILTPEQIKKLKQSLEECRMGMACGQGCRMMQGGGMMNAPYGGPPRMRPGM